MKIKTIFITDDRSKLVQDTSGFSFLYPKGARRIIVAYLFFPKIISNEKRKGLQVIEQKATIEVKSYSSSGGGCDYYKFNKWRDIGFVDIKKYSSLEKEAEAK